MRIAFERLRPEGRGRRVARDPGDGLRLRARRHDRRDDRAGHGRGRRGRCSPTTSRASDPPAAPCSRPGDPQGGDVEWRKLKWLPADQSVGRGHFDFPEPIGRQRMVRYPAGEQITVPRHVATRRVRTMITASTLAPSALGPVLPLLSARPGSRCAPRAQGWWAAMIDRLPEGPSSEDRDAARFTIVCDVIARQRRAARRDPRLRRLRPHRRRDRARRDRRRARRGPRQRRPRAVPGVRARRVPRGLDPFDVAWEVEESDGPGRRERDGLTMGLWAGPPRAARPSASRTGRHPAAPAAPPAARRSSSGSRPRASGPREDQMIDRCENCGLAVGRDVVPYADAAVRSAARRDGVGDGEADPRPNAVSLQAWLGAENWAAIRPGERALEPDARSAELLLAKRGLEVRRVRHLARSGMASMWQTLLNLLTFHRDFASEAAVGPAAARLGPRARRLRDRRRWSPCWPRSRPRCSPSLFEGGAVLARRGGVIEISAAARRERPRADSRRPGVRRSRVPLRPPPRGAPDAAGPGAASSRARRPRAAPPAPRRPPQQRRRRRAVTIATGRVASRGGARTCSRPGAAPISAIRTRRPLARRPSARREPLGPGRERAEAPDR